MFPMTGEMEDVITSSRKFAIACRHSFIDYIHFLGGILTCDCSAKYQLTSCSEVKWKAFVEKYYEQTDVSEDDELGLTKKAEKIIIHSSVYARQTNSEYISSDHLLLALLSTNNPVAEELQKSGIIFEDVSKSVFTDFEISLFRNFTPLIKKSEYTSFDKWFIPKKSISNILNEWHYIAYEFYEAEEYDQCIRACEIAQSLSNENPVFDVLKAYAYFAKRDYKDAISLFAELGERFADQTEYQIFIAYCHDEEKNYAAAAKIYHALLEKQPASTVLLNNIGFNLQSQERYSEAIPYYEAAINIDPEFAYPYDNMGFCKFKLGDDESALYLIDKALELDKGNSYAYKYKGVIFMTQDKREEAVKNFKLALKFGYTKKYGNAVNEYMLQMGF